MFVVIVIIVFQKSKQMSKSDIFVIVDSVDNYDVILKRENRYWLFRLANYLIQWRQPWPASPSLIPRNNFLLCQHWANKCHFVGPVWDSHVGPYVILLVGFTLGQSYNHTFWPYMLPILAQRVSNLIITIPQLLSNVIIKIIYNLIDVSILQNQSMQLV